MPVLTSYPSNRLRSHPGMQHQAPPDYSSSMAPQWPSSQPQSNGLDAAMLIQFMTTLPTLKQNNTTLGSIVTQLAGLNPPAKLTNNPTTADFNTLLEYAHSVGKAVFSAVGADKGNFDAIRQGIILDLLPILLNGGGNNSMSAVILMMALGGGSLF